VVENLRLLFDEEEEEEVVEENSFDIGKKCLHKREEISATWSIHRPIF